MTRAHGWVDRVGRRRVLLSVFATAWVAFGVALLIDPPQARFSRPAGPSPLDPLDSRWWGLLWVAGGVTVFATVIRHRRRRDALAFAAAITPTVTWAMFYTWSMLVWLGTAGEFGEHDAWVGLLHWLMLTLIIWLVAGWPDQADPIDPVPTG